MDVAVYLFSGFLEAGKTKFIKDMMTDPNFYGPENKYLILTCEEGVEEYEPKDYGKNVFFEAIEDQEDINPEKLSALQKKSGANIVVVEYNGMWYNEAFYNSLPEGWFVYQDISIMNSETAKAYHTNMRFLIEEKFVSADLVVFNRVNENTDRQPLHDMVRAVGRDIAIFYENTDGEVEPDTIEDPLPYDLTQPVVEIKDEDYPFFLSHMMAEFEAFDGKKVRFKGLVAGEDTIPDLEFGVGRYVITCCKDDMPYKAICAKIKSPVNLKNGDWIIVEGKIRKESAKSYGGEVAPVLLVENIKKISKKEIPEPELSVFYSDGK